MTTSNNTPDLYNYWIIALDDNIEVKFPEFNAAAFFDGFKPELLEQLSNAGKNDLARLKEADLSQAQEELNLATKNIKNIFSTYKEDFLTSFNWDFAINKAQAGLNKTRENLEKELAFLINSTGLTFTTDDETKIQAVFIEHLRQKFALLPELLVKIRENSSSDVLKRQYDAENRAAINAQQNISHTVEQLPPRDELKPPPKPTPTVGYRLDKENVAGQFISNLASGKNSDFLVTSPDSYTLFKKMADIGFQCRSPGLALLYIAILLITVCIWSTEKRFVQALKNKIVKHKLTDLDLSTITLEITTPPTNGQKQGTVVRKKGPLSSAQIQELQLEIDKNREELSKYHRDHQTGCNNKPATTTTPSPASSTSGYDSNSEEDDIEEQSSPLFRTTMRR